MSGVEVLAVLSCVGAIVSAFHGGSELLELIKEKRKIKRALRNAQTESLQDSLARGPPVVQGEYDRDFRRFGQVFAVGDSESVQKASEDITRLIADYATGIATDALKDIVITLQMTLLQNLQLAWGRDTMVDFTTLEYASEESRVNSVVALGQLYQRLATAAPIQRVPMIGMPVAGTIENLSPVMPMLPPAPAPPPANPRSVRPDSGRWSTGKAPPPSIYNLFRRPKSDTAVPRRGSQESLVPRYLLPAISAEKSDPGWLLKEVETGGRNNVRQSMSSTMSSDASSSIFEPNDLWQKARDSPEGSIISSQVQDPRASISRRRVPTSTLEVATPVPQPRLLLPCEENRFAGFCKASPTGAWKLQSGIKKAISERSRPGGMYSATQYWRCEKCMFEGRMVIEKGTKRKTYDMRVHDSSGIQWRWLFLFKSHVFLKDILPNPQASTFGCIFCCAMGKGTPIFGGVESLMNHLQQHREEQPTGEVLYRMNCIVGRVTEVGEDFDINLPPLEESGA